MTYSLRDSLDIMTGLGVTAREVRSTGGGARSPFWRQLQADMFGKRVAAMAADEGPAYGVALLAAVGCGEFKNIEEACAATVATTDEARPQAKQTKFYDRGAVVYRGLYESLKEDFRKIAELS